MDGISISHAIFITLLSPPFIIKAIMVAFGLTVIKI